MDSYKHKKWRGQHFLTDTNILKKIVAAAHIQPDETVVEIGAGTGNLTTLLAEKAKRVIAIEIDRDLIPVLRERIARICHSRACGNVEIVQADARYFDPTRYMLHVSEYMIVANIPYNITSLLIRRLLEAEPPPERMILLVQKEVAQRICATPPRMSMLSVAVQYYAEPRILFSVPRTCFSPRPKVDSAVASFRVTARNPDGSRSDGTPHFVRDDRLRFFKIVHAGFAHKRKLLASNLAEGLHVPRQSIIAVFEKLRISTSARAQELSVEEWEHISLALFPFTGK